MIFNKIGKVFVIVFALMVISASVLADPETAEDRVLVENGIRELKAELVVLTKFLHSKGYQTPSEQDFKQKTLDYFGINADTMSPISYEYIGYTYIGLSKKGRILFTYPESIFYNPNTLDPSYTPKQAIAVLNQPDNELAQQLVTYNKLLFNDNDDRSVRDFFLKKSVGYLQEIVVDFNYDKSNVLYEAALPNVISRHKADNEIWNLLFYNYQQKGYRKRLLNDLYLQSGSSAVTTILDALYNNWDTFQTGVLIFDKKVIIPQSTQDQALLHLIKLISQHQNDDRKLEDSQHLAYKYLVKFFDHNKQLEARLKQHNYYDMGLTALADKQRIISDSHNELLENHYITKSTDSYINFRKAPSTKSDIIKKLPNNTDVIKLHTEGEWLYIKLTQEPSIEGYIHLSQLQYTDTN